MDQPLLTIGAFARAVRLAPSALRYYDECGLLRPAEVDDATGYRYYTPELAGRARAVTQMRDAGMSIEAMRMVLDGGPEERREVLRQVLAEQEELTARRTAMIEELLAGDTGETGTVTVDGGELAAAIRQVRAATDTDPTSPLSGVLLDASLGALDVVATNRYWMAIRTLPTAPADAARAVLSPTNASRLSALLDHHDRVTLELASTRIRVEEEELLARETAYPAHRMLLAGLPPATTRVVAPRAELVAAIEAVRHAEFDLAVLPGGVRVGDREIPAPTEGPGMSLRLGAALTIRAVECALGPEIVLRLTSGTRPVRVTSPYQSGFLALVMPIARTADER
ncbi:MAG: MerR family transcriptional regulator [Nocardioides sp.]|uniref:DNA polymerase III subunit beta family protein n=1 Tax=Nocardioides sp. TaxID=35761 RepID=UPI0039E42983